VLKCVKSMLYFKEIYRFSSTQGRICRKMGSVYDLL
jgi:hypothetical protein